MSRTKIEWVVGPDGVQGQTWNPVTGCSKVSPGCAHCYAERIALRRLQPYDTGLPWTAANASKNVVVHHERLSIPLRRKVPTVYFVNSVSDLFHDEVSDIAIHSVVEVMRETPRHYYQVLTKRPARMLSFFRVHRPPPRNVWLGTSVEDQERAEERIQFLLQTPAAIRFLSCEPLLEDLDLTEWLFDPGLHWVICGGESGPKRRPMDLNWARSLRDQCARVHVPFFMKQVDKVIPIPPDLEIRQMPWAAR